MGVRPREGERAAPTAAEILGFGIFFGLAAGLLEGALRGVQHFLLHSRLFLSPDVVWMAPLADVFLFSLAALVLIGLRALLGRVGRRGTVGYAAVFGTFIFLIPIGALLTTTRIHWVAGVLLALGLGVQGGRMLARRAELVGRWALRTGPALAILALTGFLMVRGGRALAENRKLAALADPAPDAPNVLLLILDTVRAADLSLYGYELPTTPELERLAERGVTFDLAVSTSPWTLPSHASMFTGRYPHEMSADWLTPLDDADPTLSEHFSARGYRTAGFVGNLIYATWETGLQRGFSRYEDYPVSVAMTINSSLLGRWLAHRALRMLGSDSPLVRRTAGDINAAFLDWLDADGERPFFAFLNYMDAHAPYLPPDSLAERFGPRRRGRAPADLSERNDWSAEELAAERAAYDGEIAYADQEIGALVGELERRGLAHNTLLIITSDHGELFGEHGLVDHGNSLYRELIDVPLVLVFPDRMPEGVRIREPISLRDLAVTISHLASGDAAEFPGHSLLRFFESHSEAMPGSHILATVSGGVRMPEWMPITRGDMKSVVSDGYHYIIDGENREELYRYGLDRREGENLADSPDQAERVEALREIVRELTRPNSGDR